MNTSQTLCRLTILVLTGIASAAPPSLPAKRTLTDATGRKLDVTIISHTTDALHIRRESDGREFDIEIGKLSPDDQKFAAELQAKPPVAPSGRPEPAQPERRSAPLRPPTKPEMPNRLLVDIPPLDSQLAELTAIADQFAKDPKRTRDAENLRDRIAKARDGNSDALAELAWLIREIRCTRGLPEGAQRAFDALRLALVKQTQKALDILFASYDLNDGIPSQYADESYVITKCHAEKGEIAAMIAIGTCWINRHGISPYASAELRDQLPDDSQREVRTGIQWFEKALAASTAPDQKSWIKQLLGKAYKYNNEPEKALPLLLDGANHGNPYLMYHLADLYYQGKGCERDLKKAVEWYEKAAAKGVPSTQLAAAKVELEYGCGSLNATYAGTEFPLRAFGKAEAKRAVVIFGASGFRTDTFSVHIADFKPVIDAGWNLIIFDYPQTGPFNTVQNSIREWTASQGGRNKPAPVDFTGFGEAVVSALKSHGRYEQFLLVGNSLGAGTMAWDLANLQKDNQVRILWISPTEMFLPEFSKLKTTGNIETIGIPTGDPFVRSVQLKSWLKAHAVNTGSLGELPTGHLILGENLPYKDLVTYLVERLH